MGSRLSSSFRGVPGLLLVVRSGAAQPPHSRAMPRHLRSGRLGHLHVHQGRLRHCLAGSRSGRPGHPRSPGRGLRPLLRPF
eukprot:4288949-Alexandrium_andersonii.AAC.1